ncbi:MAG: hypothetical protein N2442_12860, partial [Spirochaetes bacterium]|nr:hypothetical protein [Spirochaetota bacterium]
MDEEDFILSHSEEIAAQTVELLYSRWGDYWKRFGKEGKQKALYDTSQHVRFLSEALRSGEPVLFHQYTGWLKTLFMGLDFPPDTLT